MCLQYARATRAWLCSCVRLHLHMFSSILACIPLRMDHGAATCLTCMDICSGARVRMHMHKHTCTNTCTHTNTHTKPAVSKETLRRQHPASQFLTKETDNL